MADEKPPSGDENVIELRPKRKRPDRQHALTPPLTPEKKLRRRALKPRDIKEAEKLAGMLNDRKAGMSFTDIAKKYGYYDATGASKAVKRALEMTIQEGAHELRRLEVERYDRWLEALDKKILEGDTRAAEVAVKISERRSRLLGLDEPVQTEVTVNARDRTMIIDGRRPEVASALHQLLLTRPADPVLAAQTVDAETTAVEEPDDEPSA